LLVTSGWPTAMLPLSRAARPSSSLLRPGILRHARALSTRGPFAGFWDQLGAGSPRRTDTKGAGMHYVTMDHFTLYQLAQVGRDDAQPQPGAARELMRREIMAVDNVEYADTTERLLEICGTVPANPLIEVPMYTSIAAAYVAGWLSFPLTFNFATASKFNDIFVTQPPPEGADVETWLEVGMWSWTWMEPLQGTASFFLLCLVFANEQRLLLGQPSFTRWLQQRQSKALVDAYPQYDADIVERYGTVLSIFDDEEEMIKEQDVKITALEQTS